MATDLVVNSVSFLGSPVGGRATIQAQPGAGNLTLWLPNVPPWPGQFLTALSVPGGNVYLGWANPQTSQVITLNQLAQSGAVAGQVLQWNGTSWGPGSVTTGVSSVFGRLGTVTGQSGDYSFSLISGTASLAQGGTGSNLSATGGSSQVLMQTGTGSPVTVSQLSAANLSNGTTGTGTVTLSNSPSLASPNLTGVPLAPTASPGTDTTQIATTAFVIANGGSGGGTLIPTAVSTNFTASTSFGFYLVTTGSSNIVATLPTAVGNEQFTVLLKKVDSGTGTVVLTPHGSETIDGGGFTISVQWQYLGIVSDGANWQIYTRN